MKQIDRYIIRELLPPFLICLLLFTFIVFAQELGRLVQLLITKDAGWPVVWQIALSLLPRIFIFTIPMSFLVGIIVGFSRLSSDHEIIAFRACGFNLYAILRPALILSLFVWLLNSLMALQLLPKGNARLRTLTHEVGLSQATSMIHPRVFTEDLPNLVLYIESLVDSRSRWLNIFLADTGDKSELKIILAKTGRLILDPHTRRVQVHLENGVVYKADLAESEKDNLSRFETTELPLDTEDIHASKPRERRVGEWSLAELWAHSLANSVQGRELLVELHMRLALAFSVWAFCLIGVPLGISTRKGGRAYGFVIGILLVSLFYMLLFAGKRLATVGTLPPVLGVWAANGIFFALGAVLLVKSNRQWDWTQRLARSVSWKSLSNRALMWLTLWQEQPRRPLAPEGASPRFQWMGVAALYISRGFLGFSLLALGAFLSLFIIFTLFELIDDIVRNNIQTVLVLLYFVNLTPQILVVVVPLSVLLGTLINFGLLEKSNQVMAFKAGGISVYRLAVPVVLLSIVSSSAMFLLQEYVLPQANQRQDSIRHMIKGRPAQTTFRPERKWALGEGHRIYNYAYFDPRQNRFGEFSLYEVDLGQQQILRRIYATRAGWDSSAGWVLENGWERDFQANAFRRFDRETFYFPEAATYFKEDLMDPKETSKMTYAQLGGYINRLHRNGLDTTELEMELYRKVSFPLSSLVMAFLAVPFSFMIGNRGAFHGIAVSVLIGIVYWGTLNLFEVLGAYGRLSPWLAAWAPNILYGAAGLYFTFRIRT